MTVFKMGIVSIIGGIISLLSGGAGGDVPGGSDTQVQFNDAGVFGGSAAFTFNKTTNTVVLGSVATPGTFQALDRSDAGVGVALTLRAGAANTAGDGGAISLIGGTSAGTVSGGGNVNITGGASGTTLGSGGQVAITGGLASTGGSGGPINIVAGGGNTTGNGGSVIVRGGPGGATSGAAGNATLSGGIPTDGNGGNVNVTGRDGVGTNRNGGNVVLTAGNPTGSGTQGALQLVNMTATGAQTATFVATNKPGAATGAPTLWWRMLVAGVTYWVPLFAN